MLGGKIMKKLLIVLIAIITIPGVIIHSSNVFADGMEQDYENTPAKINIVYFEYFIKDENGNIVKKMKQGQYIISQSDINTVPQDSVEDKVYQEQENNIDNYKINPINQPNLKEQKPNNKRRRPIMPLIDTDIFYM